MKPESRMHAQYFNSQLQHEVRKPGDSCNSGTTVCRQVDTLHVTTLGGGRQLAWDCDRAV